MKFSDLRAEAGLSIEDVAEQFGVSAATAASWDDETGQPPPDVCRSLDVLTRFSPAITAPLASSGTQQEVSARQDDADWPQPLRAERPVVIVKGANVPAEALIRSRKRVADHAEVFTPSWLVGKMLDLVQGETKRVDSRFLEPACGSGNFLVPILQRKLAAVELKYGKVAYERQHYALLALTSLYGIELLADNIAECRANMLEVFAAYLGIREEDELYRAASHVLSLNLIQGDAMKMVASDGRPIRVTEWSSVGKGKFNRRDFRLDSLTRAGELRHSSVREQASLFGGLGRHEVFTPVKDYPPMTVRELAAADGGKNADARSG